MNHNLMQALDADRRRWVENVRAAAERIWRSPLHRYYTDHTVAHSERIITLLDGLTMEMMAGDKRLACSEVFVLLAAAYLHDIGMQDERFAGGDLEAIRGQHHEISAELIYRAAERPAEAFQLGLPQEPGLIEALALVAQGHRRVDLGGPQYQSFPHGAETLRLGLLGALLRFGDELEIDHRRVDLELMKVMNLPLLSQLHWWKCHYVSGVSISDGFIRIAYQLPQSRPDYEGLIAPLVETDIRQQLAELQEVLWFNGVRVALGPSQVLLRRLVKPLPPEVEGLARELVGAGQGTAGPGASEPVSPPAAAPAQGAPAPVESGPPQSTPAIRQLLSAAFSDGELTTLCFDYFRPVYEDLSTGMSKQDKVQRLLDHCVRHDQVRQLLGLVRQSNPAQYARYERGEFGA